MKKILFVANVAKEHIAKFHIPTIKKFKDEGWQVDVAANGDEEIPYCDNQFNTCWRRTPFSPNTFKGIKELKKIINADSYDIIYCHTPVGGLVARLASKKARKKGSKVIYFAHGFHFFKKASKLNWLIFYPIERFLVKYTDRIFVINEEDFEFAKSHFNVQITKFPSTGIDFDRFDIPFTDNDSEDYRKQLDIPKDATVLIYVAELIKNKNQGMLIDVLRRLEREDVYLLLVGPDHSEGVFEEYAKRVGVYDKVRFLGWRSDVAQLLKSADICVASSIREGLGLNIVEAMYCGLPVVATNNRGHVDIIKDGENGFLVDIGDDKRMAEIIEDIIDRRVDIDRYKTHDVERFDSKKVAQSLYNEIAEEVAD